MHRKHPKHNRYIYIYIFIIYTYNKYKYIHTINKCREGYMTSHTHIYIYIYIYIFTYTVNTCFLRREGREGCMQSTWESYGRNHTFLESVRLSRTHPTGPASSGSTSKNWPKLSKSKAKVDGTAGHTPGVCASAPALANDFEMFWAWYDTVWSNEKNVKA